MVNAVSEENILKHICSLSGEIPVRLSGGSHRIGTRYSYHPDCLKAAEYLYSQFDSIGVDVAYEEYSGIPLRCIEFKDHEGYAVGDSGRIFHTEDGGETWERQSSGTTHDLWKSSFVSPDTGWVAVTAGGGRLLKTTDGGSSWHSISTGVHSPFYGVTFVDAQTGWVCGSGGIVRRTSDAGSSWTTQTTGEATRLFDVEFVDSLHGWAVGHSGFPFGQHTLYGRILHTSDGGENWESQINEMNIYFYDACFVDSLTGWVVGGLVGPFGSGELNGKILHTSDGGASWQTQTFLSSDCLYGVCFVDSLKGWVVGSGGLVLSTTDGGAHWFTQRNSLKGMGASLYSASFADDTRGWAIGGSSILRTVDGGVSWSSLNDNIPGMWRNVVATIEGTTFPSLIYVVCGHYDSVSQVPMSRAPGADDNASGISLVLETARILKDYELEHTVKFVCFSGEEFGPYGSTYYTEAAYRRGEKILGALNFDMVAYGTPNVFLVGNTASSSLVDYCIKVRDDFVSNLAITRIINNSWLFSDHASFWSKGYGALCGIELDNEVNPYWHTKNDVVHHLDMHFAADVTRLAVASAASLAQLVAPPVAEATIDIEPNTLNLNSRGRYITTYIELPSEHSIDDVDVSTVVFNGVIGAEPRPYSVGDHDCDGVPDLMVKFARAAAQNILARGDAVEVTVSGQAAGFPFEGTETLRVIGTEELLGQATEIVSVTEREFARYELRQNYPDPFNPRTVIRYELPLPSNVCLQIFDVTGKLVRTLVDTHRSSGRHAAVWDGMSQAGVAVPSGVYFYTLKAHDFAQTKKMVLLR
jgi:photosystem II stability/assembly factor-like uncharacterized protein